MTVTALHPAVPAPPAPSAAPEAPRPTIVYSPAPAGASPDLPRVFQVIHGVMKDVMPIGKDQKNTQQNYSFRGVDDAMSAMAGPMRAHGCFIAPEVVELHQRPRGDKGTHTNLKMLYRIFGPAGDCVAVTLPGEAMDTADKSTNKAMSAALKYMLFQVFMIPVDARSVDDSDQDARPPAEHRAERQQNQQRRQQQRQQRNQRQQQNGQQQNGQQQPRRSNQAEPGPWEQQAPQQGNNMSPQARQLLTSAQAAQSPEAFATVRARAEREGATAEFLARLDSIDAEKRRTAQGRTGVRCGCGPREVCEQCRPSTTRQERQDRPSQQGAPAGPSPYSISDAVAAEAAIGAAPSDDGYRAGPDAAEQAAAKAESLLRVAASKANLPTLDQDFERAFGLPIGKAGAAQLDMFRERIEAAGGAQ
ncbi:ERF family protein [Streptomyces sp. NPDC017520]|uniref:ERF family protein n=1 Tax=Streptomyces sp. NPDC017520 TaxID=3364998 RepID=UPI00379FCC28